MGENSKIQWTDDTFNPWIGCTKVSPGCAQCYAENETFTRVQRAQGKELWGKGKPRYRTSEDNWMKPLSWNKHTHQCLCGDWFYPGSARCLKCCTQPVFTHRRRVFCASMSDWLDDEVPIEWLADLLKLIHETPNLDWLLLTKRPQNWKPRLEAVVEWVKTFVATQGDSRYLPVLGFAEAWLAGIAPKNIWLGTSVEDQIRADERIPELLKIPARIRFLSVEPMLGPIDFTQFLMHDPDCSYECSHLSPFCSCSCARAKWLIFGGESGHVHTEACYSRDGRFLNCREPQARCCNTDWISQGVIQCREAGIAPFVKQLGTRAYSGESYLKLKHHKGGDMNEWPEALRVREFPA